MRISSHPLQARLEEANLHSLTASQIQMDSLQAGFTRESCNLNALAVMTVSGLVGKIARVGILSSLSHSNIYNPLKNFISHLGSVALEAATFELISQIQNPDLNSAGRNWSKHFINFSIFRLVGGGTISQSAAMVAGHQVAAVLHLEEKSHASLMQQFIQASVTTLQINFGATFSHFLTGNRIQYIEGSLERNLATNHTVKVESTQESLHSMANTAQIFSSADFTRMTKEELFLELLRLKREKNRRSTPRPFSELLNDLRNSGLSRLADGEIDDATITSANFLENVHESWDRLGAHFINLARQSSNHRVQSWAQLEYAKLHIRTVNGTLYPETSYGRLIRWGVFLSNHRDALELPEPFLVSNLSEEVRTRCNEARSMENEASPLEEAKADFVRLTRWAFLKLHRGVKSSTTSTRLRDVIEHGKFPLQNNSGLGSLEDFFDTWISYVDPHRTHNKELTDLYETTFANLKRWHLRIPNRTPEGQALIRALRWSVLKTHRGDLPQSVADAKHPIHNIIEEGEIPLGNIGSLSVVEIYEKVGEILRRAHYSREKAENLIMDAVRAERRVQNLWQAPPTHAAEELLDAAAWDKVAEMDRTHPLPAELLPFNRELVRQARWGLCKYLEGNIVKLSNYENSPIRQFILHGKLLLQSPPNSSLGNFYAEICMLAGGWHPELREGIENLIVETIFEQRGWSNTPQTAHEKLLLALRRRIAASQLRGDLPYDLSAALGLEPNTLPNQRDNSPLTRFLSGEILDMGGKGKITPQEVYNDLKRLLEILGHDSTETDKLIREAIFENKTWPNERQNPMEELRFRVREVVAQLPQLRGMLPGLISQALHLNEETGLLPKQETDSPLNEFLKGENPKYTRSFGPEEFYRQIRILLVQGEIRSEEIENLIQAAIFEHERWSLEATTPIEILRLRLRQAVSRDPRLRSYFPQNLSARLGLRPEENLPVQMSGSALTQFLEGANLNFGRTLPAHKFKRQIRILLTHIGIPENEANLLIENAIP